MPGHPSVPPARLSERRRELLLERYAEQQAPADLEALVVSYTPLARSLARRYALGTHLDLDLEQAACEGLVKAIKRFDPARGVPFTRYAVPTILGEVRRLLRDTTWATHVPRSVQELAQQARAAREAFAARRGRVPTVAEIADVLGRSAEEVVEALSAERASRTLPLDTEPARDDGLTLADRLGTVDPAFEHVEHLATLEAVFPSLAPEEQAVIRLRFGGDMTQREIARELGWSRSRVGRLLDSGIESLRTVAA